MEDPIKEEFKKLFGNMYLSESETALRIFEFGYKAGVDAEREACAKVCDAQADEDGWEGNYAHRCAAAIRQRGKE